MDHFEKNVFINCPFDASYEVLLRPLIFVIVYLDYIPRIALENSDGSVNRPAKILKLIAESQFSIHDLSRIKAVKKNEFSRLNMPFELGIDFGSKTFSDKHKEKKFLVLSDKEHDYRKALSDFSGFDIKAHANDPVKLTIIVRNWFYETVGVSSAATGIRLWYAYEEFLLYLVKVRYEEGYRGDRQLQTIEPVKEYIEKVKAWKSIGYTI